MQHIIEALRSWDVQGVTLHDGLARIVGLS